jgi:hypothetical protein
MSEIAVLVLAETMILVVKKTNLSLESTMGLAPGIAAWLTVPSGAGHGLGLLSGGWASPASGGPCTPSAVTSMPPGLRASGRPRPVDG